MKISYNWLQQFLQIDWEPSNTGELLTDLGLEVEGIETRESIKGSLEGIVVGNLTGVIDSDYQGQWFSTASRLAN